MSAEGLVRLYCEDNDDMALWELWKQHWPWFQQWAARSYPYFYSYHQCAFDDVFGDVLRETAGTYDHASFFENNERGPTFKTYLRWALFRRVKGLYRKLSRRGNRELAARKAIAYLLGQTEGDIPAEVLETLHRGVQTLSERSRLILKLWMDPVAPSSYKAMAEILATRGHDATPSAWKQIKSRDICKLRDFFRDNGYNWPNSHE